MERSVIKSKNKKVSSSRMETLKTFGAIYMDLFGKSSVPAMDVLCSPRKEPIRKMIWFAVFIILIGFTLRDIIIVLDQYFKFPVVVTYEYNTNHTLMFPDITICNINPFIKSQFCQPDCVIGIDLKQYNSSVYNRICGEDQHPKAPNKQDFEMRQVLSTWLQDIIIKGNETMKKAIQDYGHPVESMIISCQYATNASCSNATTYFSENENSFYGSCFCFHCNAEDDDEYYEYGTLSSPLNGLVINLGTDWREYLPTSSEVGFVVMIHGHRRKYSVCGDGVFVMPGYTTYVGLDVATQESLRYPYENPCIQEWPPMVILDEWYSEVDIISDATRQLEYTREECLSYCLQREIIIRCGCIHTDISVDLRTSMPPSLSKCDRDEKRQCIDEQENRTKVERDTLCGCYQACEEVTYLRDVSVAGLRPLNNSSPMDIARLVVYFHSFTYETTKAVAKYDGVRVLSNIGGINGMYIGISFYILFQVLDLLVMGVVKLKHHKRLMAEGNQPTQNKTKRDNKKSSNKWRRSKFASTKDSPVQTIDEKLAIEAAYSPFGNNRIVRVYPYYQSDNRYNDASTATDFNITARSLRPRRFR